MKLDEFVKQSLLDITKGVVGASEEASVTIAPSAIDGRLEFEPQLVTFESTITESVEAGGGISVLSLGEAKAGKRSEHLNKLSFSVPVHFNSTNVRK
ncbi:MAG: hypothetical protein QM488_15265 [Rhizobiaceae bacterium]